VITVVCSHRRYVTRRNKFSTWGDAIEFAYNESLFYQLNAAAFAAAVICDLFEL